MSIPLTYELISAAAGDAARARMRKAGRSKWNRADWNEMVRIQNSLWPHMQLSDGSRDPRADWPTK